MPDMPLHLKHYEGRPHGEKEISGKSVNLIEYGGGFEIMLREASVTAFYAHGRADMNNQVNFFRLLAEQMVSFGRTEWMWNEEYCEEVLNKLLSQLKGGNNGF